MKNLLGYVFVFLSLHGYGAEFYTTHEIPVFSNKEKEFLTAFEIEFCTLTNSKQVSKHNAGVLKLLELHGNHWRDSLKLGLESSSEEVKKFIFGMFSSQGFDKGKIGITITYHMNGIISAYKKKIPLRKNGGGMYHFRVKSKNWNQKGQKIEGSNEVFYGSA